MGDRDLEGVPDAEQHYVDAQPQRFGGVALVGVGQDDAGVGDHRVNVSELLHPGIECLLQGGLVAHIRCAVKHFLTRLFDQARRFLQVVGRTQPVWNDIQIRADVDADDIRAFLGAHDRV